MFGYCHISQQRSQIHHCCKTPPAGPSAGPWTPLIHLFRVWLSYSDGEMVSEYLLSANTRIWLWPLELMLKIWCGGSHSLSQNWGGRGGQLAYLLGELQARERLCLITEKRIVSCEFLPKREDKIYDFPVEWIINNSHLEQDIEGIKFLSDCV